MEKVRHRVHEDEGGAAPRKGLLQSSRTQLKIKTTLVRMAWNAAPAFGEGLGVAVIAPW